MKLLLRGPLVADPNTYFFHEVLDDPERTVLNCNLDFTDCVPPSGSGTDVLQLAIDDGYGAGLALGFATDSFADLVVALRRRQQITFTSCARPDSIAGWTMTNPRSLRSTKRFAV